MRHEDARSTVEPENRTRDLGLADGGCSGRAGALVARRGDGNDHDRSALDVRNFTISTRGDRAIDWIESYCVHPYDRTEPLRLTPAQREAVTAFTMTHGRKKRRSLACWRHISCCCISPGTKWATRCRW